MFDKTFEQTIVDELDFGPSVGAANIGVSVDNGLVTLTGNAASFAEKATAEGAVRRGKCIRAIAENEVRYPNDKQTADDQIAERAFTVAIEARAGARVRASRLQRFRELSATIA
jgi:hypothetical protein